jgi:O-antigen ligase
MISLAYAALWVFVFSIPWENVIVIHGLGAVSRLTGMLAAGIAGLAIVVSGRMRRWHGFHVTALVFVLWAGCSLLLFRSGLDTVPNKYWTFVMLFVVVAIIWELARSRPRLLGLMMAYITGAYVSALDTVAAYHRGAGEFGRFAAAGFDPNDLAMTLALALPMAWYLGMNHRRPLVRWICRAYLPIGVVAIGLTGSRGGLVVSVVALMIVPLTMNRLTPGRLATALFLLAGSAGLAMAYVPHTLVQRLSTTGSEVEDARFGHRFKLWVAGFHAFERRPLTGYGTGGFVRAVTSELGSDARVAHNTYLSVLVEQGIVGLILYLTLFVAVYRSIRRLPKSERRFALTLLATLAVALLPLTWEDRKPVWFILAALLGLSQAWVATGGVVRSAGPPPPVRALGPRAAARRLEPLPTPSADQDAIA